MRLSVHKSSPYYDKAKLDRHPQVYVNGTPITRCFEASEEDGWADRYLLDAEGRIQLNEVKGCRFDRTSGWYC